MRRQYPIRRSYPIRRRCPKCGTSNEFKSFDLVKPCVKCGEPVNK